MGIYFNFKEIISAFMVLFAVIDILGAIPIIISLREKNQKIEAGKAAIVSFVILVAFLFIGKALLGLFNVDISSFAGGFYGESSDFSKYYSESICIGDIGWYFISRDFME